MNVTPLSQLDKRWAREKIGKTNLTIGRYGCTLTGLTMLLNYVMSANMTVNEVNLALTNVGGFNANGLIIWSRIRLAFPSVKWTWRGYNYDNWKVAQYVYFKRLPVLVEVNLPAVGKHWVLFIRNRKMVDPIDGKIKSTSTYPLTGYSLIDKA